MTVTFYAQDNEFAAATGGNVNYSAGFSRFDYPPNSSRDLIINSQPGDSDPRLFEVGEVYTVSFSGNGGATITNATIIRSDYTTQDDGTPIEGNEGAIVFEGLDENGDLTQVVWSPNFDLETWYFDNFTGGGSPPGFYTQDQDAGQSAQFALPEVRIGLIPGAGGAVRLPVSVPRVRANEILLTGKPFGADDAASWGVINRVVPDGTALTAAQDMARDIASNAPLAVRHTLAIANAAHIGNDAAHWCENDRIITEIGKTADAAEGARAFIEKRAPVWQGK